MQRNAGGDPMARAVVHDLIRKGIKLLALDFDLTIIGLHTGGAWRGSVHQLAQHVRPCFRSLIEAALEAAEFLHLCIVTYSLQQGMIEDLLRYILPNSDTARILVRTSTKEWQKKNQQSKQSLGKQQHIAQVTTDLYNFRRAVIQPHEILLIDDDEENVDIARRFGHVAFLVKENVTLEDIYAFMEKIKEYEVTHSNSCSRLPEPLISTMNASKYDPNEYQSSSQPKYGHSAAVYMTSSRSDVPSLRHERSTDVNFAIPRPAVVSDSTRRNIQVDPGTRRLGYDVSQPHSATYMVMTNGR